jgi:transglutaminase-like putative cysteine protease
MGQALFDFIKQSAYLIIGIINWAFKHIPYNTSVFVEKNTELIQRADVLNARLVLWITGFIKGVKVEDPAARALVWSLVLWFIAVWAGWQIYSHRRFFLGMFPATALLVFILDYTGRRMEILWFHLALLLFLFGLTNYAQLHSRWDRTHIDYSDSTGMDTLIVTGVLTFGLVLASFVFSTISIKDLLENYREWRASSNEAQAEALGLEPASDTSVFTSLDKGLPRAHLITAGPTLSRKLAMTISTGDLPPMSSNAQPTVPRYYWRTLTYSNYTGSGWTNPTLPLEDISAGQSLVDPVNSNVRIVHQQVTFPNDSSKRLYWAGKLISADVPFRAVWIHKTDSTPPSAPPPDSDLMAALASVTSFNAESAILNVSAEELRASTGAYPAWVTRRFLTLPDSVPERVRALARDLTASGLTPYDRAIAIQTYLRQYPYSLEVPTPPAGRDVADYFLFDLKKGYCDYYATSMVVLARAAGLPARLVVGYANGNYNLEKAQYIVTENYAHSWVEIYFAGVGWVEFEPTASQPVINYLDKQQNETVVQPLQQPESKLEQWKVIVWNAVSNSWVLALLALTTLLIIPLLSDLRTRFLEPVPAVAFTYKRLRRFARPTSGFLPADQTTYQYESALTEKLSTLGLPTKLLFRIHEELHQLTRLYSNSLFSPHPTTQAEALNALRAWSRLRWRLIFANLVSIKNRMQTLVLSSSKHQSAIK